MWFPISKLHNDSSHLSYLLNQATFHVFLDVYQLKCVMNNSIVDYNPSAFLKIYKPAP